jgi:hypothetical protein
LFCRLATGAACEPMKAVRPPPPTDRLGAQICLLSAIMGARLVRALCTRARGPIALTSGAPCRIARAAAKSKASRREELTSSKGGRRDGGQASGICFAACFPWRAPFPARCWRQLIAARVGELLHNQRAGRPARKSKRTAPASARVLLIFNPKEVRFIIRSTEFESNHFRLDENNNNRNRAAAPLERAPRRAESSRHAGSAPASGRSPGRTKTIALARYFAHSPSARPQIVSRCAQHRPSRLTPNAPSYIKRAPTRPLPLTHALEHLANKTCKKTNRFVKLVRDH